jgi:hypothetical protein
MPLPDDNLDLTAVVLRTDFTDPRAWAAVTAAVEPEEPNPYLFIDDPEHDGLAPEAAFDLLVGRDDLAALYLADAIAVRDPERPLLVVTIDDEDEHAVTFRVLPRALSGLSANLSVGNVEIEEVLERLDPDGVLREY